jgi:hypothetical protein
MKATVLCAGIALAAGFAAAQSTEEFELSKKAASRSFGSGGGECEINVRIDQRAYVEIQGGRLRVRTLQGAPSFNDGSWCSDAIPRNPRGFNFRRTNGRGEARLEQQPGPGNNGMARIYVNDSSGGADTYRFSLTWTGGGGGNGGGGWDNLGGGGGGGDWGGGGGSWNDGTWNGYGNGTASFPMELRANSVRVDLRGNQATIRVMTNGNPREMQFSGRVQRADNDELQVDIDSCMAGFNGSQRCDGRARLRGRNRQIDTLDLDARGSSGPIKIDFRR